MKSISIKIFIFTIALVFMVSSCLPPPDSFDPEPPVVPPVYVPSATGSGLMGAYFDTAGSRVLIRTDSVLNFDWGYESPAQGVPVDRFSIVWTGRLEVPESGLYTFTVNSDDGVRLFVDGSDDLFNGAGWVEQGLTVSHTVTLNLTAGMKDIRVEHYENEWGSGIRLFWEGPGFVRQIVPQEYLYPGTAATSPPDNLGFSSTPTTPPPIDEEPVNPPPSGTTQTLQFTFDNTNDFMNPERGWMIREPYTASNFANARNGDPDFRQGYTVVWSYMTGTPWTGSSGNPFRLDNYRNSDLPQSLLTELNNVFAAARNAGVKMKIRFAYNYHDTGNDAPVARIERHIEQLAPVINANKDTIAGMDAGLVGRWGEWNYGSGTVGNLVTELSGGAGNTRWWTEPYPTAYARVYNKLLNEIDRDIMIMMRDPRGDRGYRFYFNGASSSRPLWSNFNANDRFTGSHQSRVGWYIDCLFTNRDHAGTFDYDGGNLERDMQAAGLAGRYAVTSGETCEVGGLNSYNDGAAVIQGMESLGGPDHLYRKFSVDVYNKWISSGHFNEISRRLGYRIGLTEVTIPTSIQRGTSNSITIGMRNDGFGKVYNPRPLEIVLVSGSSVHRISLSEDIRRDLPLAGQTVSFTKTFTVPSNIPAGTYNVALALPDLSQRLRSDVRYSIRLANTGSLWDSTRGINNLGASVQIV